MNPGTTALIFFAADAAFTAAAFLGLDRLQRGARPVLTVVLAALVFPLLLLAWAGLRLIQPNPEHHDAAGKFFAAAVLTSPMTAGIGLLTGVVIGLTLRSKRREGQEEAAERT